MMMLINHSEEVSLSYFLCISLYNVKIIISKNTEKETFIPLNSSLYLFAERF